MAELFIDIKGEIGVECQPKEIRNQLKNVKEIDTVFFVIDSPGGYVNDGDAIATYIQQCKATRKIALIEGYCGSIATRIANACDFRKIIPTGEYMIHFASGAASGNRDEMRQAFRELKKIDELLIDDYQRITGLGRMQIEKYMQEEKRFSAQEAYDKGFIDEIIQPLKAVAKFRNMEINDEAKTLLDELKSLVGLAKKPKNMDEIEEDAKNISVELDGGGTLLIEELEGELVGGTAYLISEEGTQEKAPDGTHKLADGTSLVTQDGIVKEVIEPEPENKEDELKKKMEAMEKEISDLKAKNKELEDEKSKAKGDAERVKNEIESIKEVVNKISKATVGKPFTVDKPLVKPTNKSSEKVVSPESGLETWGGRILEKYK